MKKVSKIKLKPKASIFIKVVGVILCILLGLFLFYRNQINDLKKIHYSEEASKKILFSFHKDYVMSIGENKTLNEAFESDSFIENNLERYAKIDYYKQDYFVENINALIKKGYSNNDINIILAHGNGESVKRFSERDKVRYLEEFFSVDYAKLDNYDRYIAYSDETGEDEETTVLYVNMDLDKEDYVDPVIVSDFSIDMLVNKHRAIKEDFVPNDLIDIPIDYASSNDLKCSKVAFDAYKKMNEAALKEGCYLVINSAYRSYQEQLDLMDYYRKAYGDNYVNKYVAFAGHSEHQTGLAFDIGSQKANIFATSREYEWMQENAYKYGFIQRFKKIDEGVTGFRAEPWHYRYVGVDIAKTIHESGLALEEYWVMYLDK